MAKVLMIESRNANDVFHRKAEAETLSTVLQLGDIKVKYSEVGTLEYLIRAIKRGLTDPVKYVHFSAHGLEEGTGFVLTNGDVIKWDLLQQIVQERLKNKYLIFSSCFVANGVKKIFSIDPTFCRAIVAPTRAIYWDEGLIAYSAFYHRALTVTEKTTKSVKIMNSITQPGTFKCIYNRTVKD